MPIKVSTVASLPKPKGKAVYPRLMTNKNIKVVDGSPSVVVQISEDKAVCLNHWSESVGHVFDLTPNMWVPFYGSVTITSEP